MKGASRATCGPEGAVDSDRRPSIAVWHLPGAPDDIAALREILGDGDACDVLAAESMEEWVAAPADLTVLRGTTGYDPRRMRMSIAEQIQEQLRDPEAARARRALDEARRAALAAAGEFTALRGRRVLGIGEEAGRAFEALGLDIGAGLTASFDTRAPALVLGTGDLVPPTLRGTEIGAFATDEPVGSEGLHIPATSDTARRVEVLARCACDPNYAPLARQQNYVFCCVGADARAWTGPFRSVVREIAIGLTRRPLEAFALSVRPLTQPGTHEFDLAPSGCVAEAYRQEFSFRFDAPVLLTAELEVADSDATMLFLRRERGTGDMHRLDGRAPSTLLVHMPVTEESIRANRGRHWSIEVTNFDARHRGRYRLRITIDTGARIRFADGLVVPITDPPSDDDTISGLLARLRSDDADTAARAEAALLVVGAAATPALQAGRLAADGFDDRYVRALVRIQMREQ